VGRRNDAIQLEGGAHSGGVRKGMNLPTEERIAVDPSLSLGTKTS